MVIKAVALGNLAVLPLAGQTIKGKLVFYMVSFLCIISCINQFNSTYVQLDIFRRQSAGWLWIKQKR